MQRRAIVLLYLSVLVIAVDGDDSLHCTQMFCFAMLIFSNLLTALLVSAFYLSFISHSLMMMLTSIEESGKPLLCMLLCLYLFFYVS